MYRVLAVCTGNICRSPAIERWFGHLLGEGAGVTVTSAGAQAVVGAPIDPTMATLIRAGGGSTDGFSARQLEAGDVAAADLVLTVSHAHSSAVRAMLDDAAPRTFTVGELARLLAPGVPDIDVDAPVPQRLGAAVALAAERRRSSSYARPADDVPDPIGRAEPVYRAAADALWFAVSAIGRSAGLAPLAPHGPRHARRDPEVG